MSRIGKKPITIPEGVEVKIDGQSVLIKGPKGELKDQVHPLVKVEVKDNNIIVDVAKKQDKTQKALWGLWGSLITNMVKGVTEGYEKKLEVVGVGYKVNLEGKKLVLNLGYSHPIDFNLPEGVEAQVDKNTITISGIDKRSVGEVTAQIRKLRKPEPYKGKGIKYEDEIIKKKVGKASTKGE